MDKKKQEPRIIPINVNLPDDRGKERWYNVDLALTDNLVGAIKDIVTVPAKVPDYNRMRVEAYQEFCDECVSYNTTAMFNHRDKGSFQVKNLRIPHPNDWIRLKARLEEIDRLEGGKE